MKKRGQIVIPETVRDALDLREGDILEVDVAKYVKSSRPQAQSQAV